MNGVWSRLSWQLRRCRLRPRFSRGDPPFL